MRPGEGAANTVLKRRRGKVSEHVYRKGRRYYMRWEYDFIKGSSESVTAPKS